MIEMFLRGVQEVWAPPVRAGCALVSMHWRVQAALPEVDQ